MAEASSSMCEDVEHQELPMVMYVGIAKILDTDLTDRDIVINPPHAEDADPVFIAYVLSELPAAKPLEFKKIKGGPWKFICEPRATKIINDWYHANKSSVTSLLKKKKQVQSEDESLSAVISVDTLRALKFPTGDISFLEVAQKMEIRVAGHRYLSMPAQTYQKVKGEMPDMKDPRHVMVVRV